LAWRLGNSSGISNIGTKAKSITSYDNAFVTNLVLLPLPLRFRAKDICWHETLERATQVKWLIGRPQEALLCAKAKRQQQSAQSERKSAPRYGDGLKLSINFNFQTQIKAIPNRWLEKGNLHCAVNYAILMVIIC